MPTIVTRKVEGERPYHDMVAPDDVAAIELIDTESGYKGVLLLLCDKSDVISKVHALMVPDGLQAGVNPITLKPYCTEENRILTLPHQKQRLIDTYSPSGKNIEVHIAHYALLALNCAPDTAVSELQKLDFSVAAAEFHDPDGS